MVHDLKPLVAFGKVDARDVHDTLVLALGVVAEEREHGDDARGADVERKFILEHRELLDVFGETLDEVGAVGVQLLSRISVFREGRVGGGGLRERGRRSCLSLVESAIVDHESITF